MSTFITRDDYLTYIEDKRLIQLTNNDSTKLDSAEETAISVVKDSLHTRFDVDVIFATTGTARPQQVVRWVIVLALYYIYERVADAALPERIINNYNDVLDKLKDIEDGKPSIFLPRYLKDDGNPKTKFRWGSQPPRTH